MKDGTVVPTVRSPDLDLGHGRMGAAAVEAWRSMMENPDLNQLARSGGGCEVNVDSGFTESRPHIRVLVGGIVVNHGCSYRRGRPGDC